MALLELIQGHQFAHSADGFSTLGYTGDLRLLLPAAFQTNFYS